MFGRKAVVEQQPVVSAGEAIRLANERAVRENERNAALLTPVNVDAEVEEAVYQEQIRVCTALGYEPLSLLVLRFKYLLEREGIKIYPYENVERFLDNKYGKCTGSATGDCNRGRTWSWRPMRPQDVYSQEAADFACLPVAKYFATRHSGNGRVLYTKIYTLPVPLHAQLVAEVIAKEIPQVRFYISDIQTDRDTPPDPFLACIFDNCTEIFVVAHWDEPSYK